MVAVHPEAQVSLLRAVDRPTGPRGESPRTGRVQPIGDLMSQVLARYLPADDVRQQRNRLALEGVSAAAG